ncbi:Mov34/MPN/PAD-1 family protein [Nocardia salmonicida]|uniref:Mov34/MPN/PAD-1 family protein n=1 Tax=Nocardia salmonicida TaxID=53431 RepID=UPI00378D5C45
MTRTRYRIELGTRAFEHISALAMQARPAETGGILLGYRQDDLYVVTHALAIDTDSSSAHHYVRDDRRANTVLAQFLADREDDDPIGYIGEWHTHTAAHGPSRLDHRTMAAIARISSQPVSLIVHAVDHSDVLFGVIAKRRRFGRITTDAVAVHRPAGPKPNHEKG